MAKKTKKPKKDELKDFDEGAAEASAESFIRAAETQAGASKKMLQGELDRLKGRAVQGDRDAVKELKELLAKDEIHLDEEGIVRLGPKPEVVQAPAAPAKPEGKAKVGKTAGQPLPKPRVETPEEKEAKAAAFEREAKESEAKKLESQELVKKNAAEKKAKAQADLKEKFGDYKVKEAPKSDEGPVLEKAPVKAEKPVPKTIGAEAAQAFRERAKAQGVNADDLLKLSKTKVQQLDRLPDNAETNQFMDKWLAEKAKEPAARAARRMTANRDKALAGQSPAQKAEQNRRRSQERIEGIKRRRSLPGDGNSIKDAELLGKNFAQISQENFKGFSDRIVKTGVAMSRVDRQKAAEVEAAFKALNKREGGFPQTLLADELDSVMKEFNGAKTPQDIRRATNRLAGFHKRIFSGGRLRKGVLDIEKTGAAVKAAIAEEAAEARGPRMGTELTNPKLFNQKKKALFQTLKRVSGAKTIKELKTLIRDQGIPTDLRRARTQKEMLSLLREKDIDALRTYVKNRKDEVGELVSEGKAKAISTKAPEAPAAKAAGAAAEVNMGSSTARGDKWRKVLSERGLTEKQLLTQINKASTLGKTYKRIEDVPEQLDERIGAWIDNAASTVKGKTGKAPKAEPKGGPSVADPVAEAKAKVQRNFEQGAITAEQRDAMLQQIELKQSGGVRADVPPEGKAKGATKAPKPSKATATAAAAVDEAGIPGGGFAAAGAKAPPKVAKGLRKEMVGGPAMRPGLTAAGYPGKDAAKVAVEEGKALARGSAGATNLAKYDASLAARQGLKAVMQEAPGKLSGLGRILGPIGIAFGVYEILSRLKGQTADRADEERMRVMQALGSVRGGLDEDVQTKELLGQQNTMIGLAGIQRQQDLDAMRRQYTESAEMNNLVRSNQDLLSAIAMPSQPSVAELMARM